nr:hypothetical protein [Tanacetum cinerariifolium]
MKDFLLDTLFANNNKDALIDGKEHDEDIQKSVSPNIHSSSSGAQTRKQGDKTENKDKGKSPVVTITGFKDLNAEFKECNNNISNEVNAASSSVSTAGQNYIYSTNDFSAAGPSNAVMPNLEDLSHDVDDVGAEADINNLESIISVSPIPTTRIHKDHPTSQIIGCYLRNVVIEIAVLNILSDAMPITTNGIQLTMSNPQERVDSPIVTNSRVTPSWREIVSLTVLVKLASYT